MSNKENRSHPSYLHKRSVEYSSDSGFPWETGKANDGKYEIYRSSDIYIKKEPANNLEHFSEYIFGRNLKWYQNLIIWPLVILLVGELFLRFIQITFPLPLIIFETIATLFRISVFIFLNLKALHKYQATKSQAMAATILAGFFGGFILAILQLFWYPEIKSFPSLIIEPFLYIIIAGAVSWILNSLFNNN